MCDIPDSKGRGRCERGPARRAAPPAASAAPGPAGVQHPLLSRRPARSKQATRARARAGDDCYGGKGLWDVLAMGVRPFAAGCKVCNGTDAAGANISWPCGNPGGGVMSVYVPRGEGGPRFVCVRIAGRSMGTWSCTMAPGKGRRMPARARARVRRRGPTAGLLNAPNSRRAGCHEGEARAPNGTCRPCDVGTYGHLRSGDVFGWRPGRRVQVV